MILIKIKRKITGIVKKKRIFYYSFNEKEIEPYSKYRFAIYSTSRVKDHSIRNRFQLNL